MSFKNIFHKMKIIIAVGIGSCIGGILRYLLTQLIQTKFISTFPFGTLSVNIMKMGLKKFFAALGVFLLAWLLGLVKEVISLWNGSFFW